MDFNLNEIMKDVSSKISYTASTVMPNIGSLMEEVDKKLTQASGSNLTYKANNNQQTKNSLEKVGDVSGKKERQPKETIGDSETSMDYQPPEPVIENYKDIAPMLEEAAQQASQEHDAAIPPYLLAAIYDQESSFGMNDSNKNPDIGEEAWRMGLTKGALEETGGSVQTKEEAFRTAADYLGMFSKKYDYDPKTDERTVVKDFSGDPAELYLERYVTQDSPLYEDAKKSFPQKLEFWKNYYDKMSNNEEHNTR